VGVVGSSSGIAELAALRLSGVSSLPTNMVARQQALVGKM
jgi:hypothetical protein